MYGDVVSFTNNIGSGRFVESQRPPAISHLSIMFL